MLVHKCDKCGEYFDEFTETFEYNPSKDSKFKCIFDLRILKKCGIQNSPMYLEADLCKSCRDKMILSICKSILEIKGEL